MLLPFILLFVFHPFKYRYHATLLREEAGIAVLKVQMGAEDHELRLPRNIVPKEVHTGGSFILTMQPENSANEEAQQTMQKLLEDLIR
jgi:hypothetical protein